MKTTYIVYAVIALVVIAAGAYFLTTRTNANSPDEIFAESSQQLGFTRAQVGYFDIFPPDKIQYNLGNGVTFAYKSGGTWHIAGPASSQEVPLCSTLVDVPEQYRQACYDENTQQNLYTDAQGQNLNYPISQMIKYIGQ